MPSASHAVDEKEVDGDRQESIEPGLTDRAGDANYKAPRAALHLSEFVLVRRLGDGSYAQVVEARHKQSQRRYAIKIVDKHLVLRHKQTQYVRNERLILDRINYAGVVNLHFTFQDDSSLYLGLDLCPNGELFDQIQQQGRLPLETARTYAAEIALMLVVLRKEEVIHRDLKPENLMLDGEGHLKLIDFGSAKVLFQQQGGAATPTDSEGNAAATAAESTAAVAAAAAATSPSSDGGADVAAAPDAVRGTGSDQSSREQADGAAPLRSSADGSARGFARPAHADRAARKSSFVGTADYVAPETLNNLPVTPALDLWSLGCVLYQMLVGRPPFRDGSEYLTFQRIEAGSYELPDDVQAPARDLLQRLLVTEAGARLGAADLSELLQHPFFEGIDWEQLRSQPAPKFSPPAGRSADEEAVDWEFTTLAAKAAPQGVQYFVASNGDAGAAGNTGSTASDAPPAAGGVYASGHSNSGQQRNDDENHAGALTQLDMQTMIALETAFDGLASTQGYAGAGS